MSRLWAMTVDFESVAVGDTLPVLIKWETEETIQRYAALHAEADDDVDGPAPESLPVKTVEGYISELLGKGFPRERLDTEASTVEVEHLQAVRPNDTISLSGGVVGKHESDGLRLVECAITVENDRGEPVARARAVVSL